MPIIDPIPILTSVVDDATTCAKKRVVDASIVAQARVIHHVAISAPIQLRTVVAAVHPAALQRHRSGRRDLIRGR